MSGVNAFVREASGYKRNLNVIDTAIEDAAHYLVLRTGRSIEEARAHVRSSISTEGKTPLKPRSVKILKRQENGDRLPTRMNLDVLIKGVIDSKSVLSPNLVVYDNTHVNPSCTAAYIAKKMADRKVIKRRGILADQDGNIQLSMFCGNAEAAIKLLINSLSGAHASPHNPHYNKTAHTTLTSTSRVVTSYSNSVTERALAGTRHYYSKDIVINNIISVTRNTDYEKLRGVMDKYSLHTPTIEEAMALVKRSSDLYWRNLNHERDIENLLSKLTGEQLASFVYTGDLYHVAKYNDALVRDLITDVISIAFTDMSLQEAEVIVSGADEDTVALVGILCAELLKGGKVSDLRANNPDGFRVYAENIRSTERVFREKSDLIEVLLRTDNVPPSICEFPSSIRRAVLGSDTDSTMFTVQEWVKWYYGKLVFTPNADKVANVLVYIDAQMITHTLAIVSKQLGVVDELLFEIKMKNEYAFPVYLKANRAKHYATLISSREGSVFKKPKLEIKGVALKDSKIPDYIIQGLHAEFEYVMSSIYIGKKVDLDGVMQRIANMEHEIMASISKGETRMLSSVSVNVKEAYEKPMSSNYLHHDLGTKVFAERYGEYPEPPYRSIKIPVTLSGKRKVDAWVATLDPATQERFNQWNLEIQKKKYSMILLPKLMFSEEIPDEFKNIVDKRRLCVELLEGAYILMEICGRYFKNKNNTRIISDDIPYRPQYGVMGSRTVEDLTRDNE